MKNLNPGGGTGKLRNYWEDEVHVVIHQAMEDTPVYEVKPEKGGQESYIEIYSYLVTTYRCKRGQPGTDREYVQETNSERDKDEYRFGPKGK